MEEYTIVSHRVSVMPVPLTPGSVPSKCLLCAEAVWLAPSSQALIAENPTTRVMCVECTSKEIGPDSDVGLIPSELQELELRRYEEETGKKIKMNPRAVRRYLLALKEQLNEERNG